MLNDVLSTYTYDAENRIATRDVELFGGFGVPMSSREAVIVPQPMRIREKAHPESDESIGIWSA